MTGVAILGAIVMVAPALASTNGGGFDQYGYNYTARIFNGSLSQWCASKGITDSTICGSYGFGSANDQLIMKWNAQWDNCNAAGNLDPSACTGAWTDNEFNGNVPGGDGYVWHYKIVWVGDYAADPTLIPAGGYGIWGEYAVLMDQGVTPGSGHSFYAFATPNGYGSY